MPHDVTRATEQDASVRALFLTVFPPIMLPVFLAVIDQTIVATALPAIARSVGGVERVSWVVISYLVANTVAAPVYGRLGDLYGRRRLMLVALAIFIPASLACALARGIAVLTLARVVQGLGGGGLMVLAQALIGESVPSAQRGNFQGYLAAVIVCGSTFGPVAGGFLTQGFGWPSIFLVNLPLGALAVLLVLRLPAQGGRGGRLGFDWPGLLLLTTFVTPLLLALDEVQHLHSGAIGGAAALLAIAIVSLLLLLWWERRAHTPLLPPALLRQPSIWRADAMAACSGASLVTLVTYLPLYLHVVRGVDAAGIGLLLLPLTISVGAGSFATGRLISRTGRTAIFPAIGLCITAAAWLVLALFAPRFGWFALTLCLVVGAFCQGSAMPVAQVTIQIVAGRAQLGAGAASALLARSLGSAVGLSLAGAALFGVLAAAGGQATALFAAMVERGQEVLAPLDPAHRALVLAAIEGGFRAVFLTVACFALGIVLTAWTLPLRRV